MSMAQVGAAAGNRRSRHLQFAPSRVFVPFDVRHRVLWNEQDQHKHRNRDSAPMDADRQEHQKKRREVPEGGVETITMSNNKSDKKRRERGDDWEGPLHIIPSPDMNEEAGSKYRKLRQMPI